MKALLTGATGFIGSHTLDRLLERGAAVRVLVRPETLNNVHKSARLQRPNVEVFPGDLNSESDVQRAVLGMDVVYDLAWEAAPGGVSLHDMMGAEMDPGSNARRTKGLLNASIAGGARRYVFCSSVCVYGFGHPEFMFPLDEDTPLNPSPQYGEAKAECEQSVRSCHGRNGMETVIIRPSHAYGAGATELEPIFARALLRPRRFIASDRGSGWQWVHVSDMGLAMVLAGEEPGAGGEVINIAGAATATAAELVMLVQQAVGRPGNWWPVSDSQPLRYDITKARTILGFEPTVSFADGVKEMTDVVVQRFNTGPPGGNNWQGTGWP